MPFDESAWYTASSSYTSTNAPSPESAARRTNAKGRPAAARPSSVPISIEEKGLERLNPSIGSRAATPRPLSSVTSSSSAPSRSSSARSWPSVAVTRRKGVLSRTEPCTTGIVRCTSSELTITTPTAPASTHIRYFCRKEQLPLNATLAVGAGTRPTSARALSLSLSGPPQPRAIAARCPR